MYCKDCKWWKRYCNAKVGDCEKMVFDTSGELSVIDNIVRYGDPDDYYSASVDVGENFGCIHFEKR